MMHEKEKYGLREGDDVLVRMTVDKIKENCVVVVKTRVGGCNPKKITIHRNFIVKEQRKNYD
jgi:hypothetical protein